ncbi:MAG: ribonuclease III domain-containing protein [Cyanobacteria bacterium P01_F01_bin.42]
MRSFLVPLSLLAAIPFKPEISNREAQALPASSLAYLGDAVYELYVRSQELTPVRRIQAYHLTVVAKVKAEAQAQVARQILPLLSASEQDIFRRARNSAEGKPKRLAMAIYRQATGLEAVLGYLYLTDQDRLMEILEHCNASLPCKELNDYGAET